MESDNIIFSDRLNEIEKNNAKTVQHDRRNNVELHGIPNSISNDKSEEKIINIYEEIGVKDINSKKTEIDLSRYLSVGEHKVEISANYAPTMSPIKVELNAPNNNVTQQTSGNGRLNYQLDVFVR